MRLSILTASYGSQSQAFINLCYRSLEAQTFQDFEVIHVSSGEFQPHIPVLGLNRIHHHSKDRLHYPAAIAKTYEISNQDSEYIFMLNDDVILSDSCLQNMINFLDQSADTILNPMSPCCNGRAYMAPLGFSNGGENIFYAKNHYQYGEMAKNVDHIIKRSIVHSPMFFPKEQVWFFATMMKRSVWEKVGGIDSEFRTGMDDQDMSLRARQKGINVGIFTGASVFHFSGATADKHLSDEDRAFNPEYFKKKHGIS